jgi:ribosomal protein L16 Arg81 hydroxylase
VTVFGPVPGSLLARSAANDSVDGAVARGLHRAAEAQRRMEQWDIARLIAPTPVETFYAEYWEKKALVIRRSQPQAYESLVSLGDVDRVITTNHLSHPDVAMANALREVATADYTFDGGAIDIVRLYQQFAAGATIIMNQLHRYVPTLGALVRSIELELSARMQTNIYLSPREAQGLKIHYDSHDVFVLQVHGVKHWNLYETQVPLPFRGQHFGDEPVEPGPIVQEFDLHPGDMLYMPRGMMHAAGTASDSSMHITMGVLHTTWAELLIEALARYGATDADFRRALPPGFARKDFDRAGAEKTFRILFERALDGADFDSALEVFVDDIATTRAPLLQGQLQQVMRLAEITADSVAGARPNLLYRLASDEQGITICCAGRDLRLPPHAADAAMAALGSPRFVVKDLPGDLDDAGKVVLVRRLVREGIVRVEG